MGYKLSDTIIINKTIIKNRIVMPPLVCFNWADQEGFETVPRVKHYGERAKGGTGLIVIEASAISKPGRLCNSQIGLWSDDHIAQFERIAESCHKYGTKVIVQLVHAGMKAIGEKNKVYSASASVVKDKTCVSMTIKDIENVIKQFVKASVRAYKAGLDGVEIHGAHGYLLNQFTSKVSNQRDDQYGKTLDDRLRLPLEIIKQVRIATSSTFIIGYRFGINDPTLTEDSYFTKLLQDSGVDMLNVSAGIGFDDVLVPKNYPFSKITYLGTTICEVATIPVVVVYGIRTKEQANLLIESNYADMVAVGRGILADPEWANKALHNGDINICYHCKPRCHYVDDGYNCPWNKKIKTNKVQLI